MAEANPKTPEQIDTASSEPNPRVFFDVEIAGEPGLYGHVDHALFS